MKIKGVCLHHDAGVLGSAVPKIVWKNRILQLKEIGCNAIRMSHNPQSTELYDMCDELGMLVMDEAFDEWEFPKKKWLVGWNVGDPGFQGAAEYFREHGKETITSMIMRDRNHPSVFMWSIGNEVDYPNDPYTHPILDKEGIEQYHVSGYQPGQPVHNGWEILQPNWPRWCGALIHRDRLLLPWRAPLCRTRHPIRRHST